MVLGSQAQIGRSLAVWALVTATVAGCWGWAGAGAASLVSSAAWNGSFEDLIVAVASAAVVITTGWLWAVTTLTVADLLRGHDRGGRGLTRRLVLTACGVAVMAGVSGPALAGSGSHQHGLAGLPLPDRAVVGARAHQSPHPAPRVAVSARGGPDSSDNGDRAPITVRAGDSLWSIARADLGPDASVGAIDARWRALYAANRVEIGKDPDLIRPGQRLRPGALDPHPDR